MWTDAYRPFQLRASAVGVLSVLITNDVKESLAVVLDVVEGSSAPRVRLFVGKVGDGDGVDGVVLVGEGFCGSP